MKNNKYSAFLTVVNLKSLSKAADVLHYTPSGVSQLITSLEDEIGFKLLIRTHQGVTLTPFGKEILPIIQNIVDDENELNSRVDEIHRMGLGILNIGAYPSIASLRLPAVVNRYREIHPNVQINIMDDTLHQNLEEGLIYGTVDIAFFGYQEKMPFNWVPLEDAEILLAMSINHALADEKNIVPENLKNETFVTQTFGSDYEFEKYLQDKDIVLKSTVHVYDDRAAVYLVRETNEIAVINSLAKRMYNTEGITTLSLNPPIMITMGMATNPQKSFSSIVTDFMKLSIEMLQCEKYRES